MKSGAQYGFSIVEMIAVAGIVLVLGAIILPLLSRTQALRDNTVCVSNLRQIGLGIIAYSSDNNSILPGPLSAGQFPYRSEVYQLSWHIADYLDLDKTASKNRSDVFVCPAYKSFAGRNIANVPVYRVNVKVPMTRSPEGAAPFGYPNVRYPALYGKYRDDPPLSIISLNEILDEKGQVARTTTWAIKDLDNSDPFYSAHFPVYGGTISPVKVHVTHRNALFFDFHVEPADWHPAP